VCLLCVLLFVQLLRLVMFQLFNQFLLASLAYPCKASSLVKNLLGSLFKLTPSFVVHLLLFRNGGSSVCLNLLLLLPARGKVSASSRRVSNLLGSASICLLGRAALGLGCGGGIRGLFFRLLANDVEHAILECLLVLGQPVLLPSVVEDATVEVVPLHARIKETDASPIVGLLLELESTAVLHEFSKFGRVAPAELLKRSLNLLLLDRVILLVLAATGQALPGERALDEVEKHVANRLQIVASTLLDTLVRGNRRISGGSSQVLAILVGDVLALAVLVALGQAEVDDKNVVSRGLRASDQEIVGLDITVDDSLLMHLLYSLDELRADKQDCFKVELAATGLEEVF